MTKTLKTNALALILAVGVFALTTTLVVRAQITSQETTPYTGSITHYNFFATSSTDTQFATTTSATSTGLVNYFDASGRLDNGMADIRGAKKVTFYFGRGTGGGNTGNSKFEVEVSPDGTNWYDFNKLRGADLSSTATSTYTIVAATSTVAVSMDLTYDTYKYARCIVNEVTDGTHYCAATVLK